MCYMYCCSMLLHRQEKYLYRRIFSLPDSLLTNAMYTNHCLYCNRNNVLRPMSIIHWICSWIASFFFSGDRRSWRIGALSAAAPPGLRCFASSESLKTSRRNQPSMHWIWRGTINYRRWRKRRRNLWLGKMNDGLRAKYIAIEMMDQLTNMQEQGRRQGVCLRKAKCLATSACPCPPPPPPRWRRTCAVTFSVALRGTMQQKCLVSMYSKRHFGYHTL